MRKKRKKKNQEEKINLGNEGKKQRKARESNIKDSTGRGRNQGNCVRVEEGAEQSFTFRCWGEAGGRMTEGKTCRE